MQFPGSSSTLTNSLSSSNGSIPSTFQPFQPFQHLQPASYYPFIPLDHHQFLQYPTTINNQAPNINQLLYYPDPNQNNILNLQTASLPEEVDDLAEVARCHLHSKPQLNCKLCRKYKSAVYEIGRIGQIKQAQKPNEDKPNMVEITDNVTFNVNNLLRANILSSEYYKWLFSLKHFSEIVDELYQYADHAEPYVAGNSRAPSTLFCCLYKLFTMKLTEKQVSTLLDHVDSPYIRCTGFLYLRYVHPPEKLGSWYEPYFLDDEEFTPGSDKLRKVTMGEYVESLLTEDKYFTTVLPRLPVKIKNQYGAQLIAMDEHRRRKKSNKQKLDQFIPGRKVSACSNGDWLEGEIIEIDESILGQMSVVVKLEDLSEETIDLGLVVLQEKPRSRSRDRKKYKYKKKQKSSHSIKHSGSRSRSRSRERRRRNSRSKSRSSSTEFRNPKPNKTQEQLLNEFKRREREKVLATGKDYARRPTSYKSSLSLKFDTTSVRKRSRSPSPIRYTQRDKQPHSYRLPNSSFQQPESAKSEPSSEHKQKIAQLMERYSKSQVQKSGKRDDQEGPDVMRLG